MNEERIIDFRGMDIYLSLTIKADGETTVTITSKYVRGSAEIEYPIHRDGGWRCPDGSGKNTLREAIEHVCSNWLDITNGEHPVAKEWAQLPDKL